MLAVIIFIVILGVLVFVHELGHFVTARRNGIKAHEFGFGFPPRILGVQFLYQKGKRKGWRLILGTKDGDDEQEKNDLAEAHEKKISGGTIYSLNWIPLGGFVKIKGEDGGAKNDPDSFAGKSAWSRIKVLAAGVFMNFILAWFLISITFTIGAPQAVDSDQGSFPDSKIQIASISPESPADEAGLKVGDEILRDQKNAEGEKVVLDSVKGTQEFINENSGKEISLNVRRGDETFNVDIIPRTQVPEKEGPLGIALLETAIIEYPFFTAIWEGLKTTLNLIVLIVVALFDIIRDLIVGEGVNVEVAGPVGIASLTRDAANLGLVYILHFAAILSINLGIINILPIPALDGGRIIFVLIEKIKGSPVSQRVEQAFHSIGFLLLILLLILVTFNDVLRIINGN